MPVAKTASPNVSPIAPKARPRKVRPSSSTRSAARCDSTTEISRRTVGCEHDRPFLPQGTGREALGRNRGYQRIRLPPDSKRNVTDGSADQFLQRVRCTPDCFCELGVAEGVGAAGVALG